MQLSGRVDAAELRVCQTLATTAAGLACQAELAHRMMEHGEYPDGRDLQLIRSIREGARRLG